MRNRSILTEAKQIQLATELISLGARLQVLEMNTDLSRERLVKLYPPRSMPSGRRCCADRVNDDTIEINGWKIYAHPLFLDQLEAMIEKVERARKKDPKDYKKKRAAKLLAAVLKVAFEDIPDDPTRDIYRQGATLGERHFAARRAHAGQAHRRLCQP